VHKLIRGIFAAVAMVTASTVALPAWSQTAPTLTGAASRKVHGAAGTFDLWLGSDPTNPTVEPRTGPAFTIVFTFNKAVTGWARSMPVSRPSTTQRSSSACRTT
jgi:hypothetical protein